jgi:D-arginine utilization repressor
MTHNLDPFIPVCDAIALLLAPRGEVVLHDLKANKIHHIANCFSKRQKGDDSLNDLKGLDFRGPTIGPYTKVNWNGRRLKSVSSVLRGQDGKLMGLLCINHDVEGFAEVLEQIASLIALPPASEKTGNIFPSDWRERINQLLADFTAKRNVTLAGLTGNGLNDLIAYLDADGVFEIRNATQYLAKVLNVSRATLYNRLRKTRDNAAPE